MIQYMMADFETASGCDLKLAGAARYAEDPTTEVLCFNWVEIDRHGTPIGPYHSWSPYRTTHTNRDEYALLMLLLAAPLVMWCAHSAWFEKNILRRLCAPYYGWHDVPDSRWHDTMASCACKVVPQQLDMALRELGIEEAKDKEGSKITIALSKPNKKTGAFDRSPETIQRVIDYCNQDVKTECLLHREVGFLPQGERRVWLLDQEINERGIKLDMDYVAACQDVVDQSLGPGAEEFAAITGGLAITQGAKFLTWCNDHGLWIPNLQKETVMAVLGPEDWNQEAGDPPEIEFNLAAVPEHVLHALELKRELSSSSIAKLASMRACVNEDGRARGLMQYHGAGPGRWAGRLIQPHNFPRGVVKMDPGQLVDLLMMRDPEMIRLLAKVSPIKAVSSGLRHAVVAEEGYAFNVGDFAGIEARIVLALSGQHDKTALMASGADVYCDMATLIYGRPITKADVEARQIGKNTVLGCGFQMGWSKFRWKYARHMPEEFCRGVIDTYRKVWASCVPKLWYALEDAAVATVHTGLPHEAYGVVYEMEGRWLTALLHSGRKLWYLDPQPCRKSMPWDETDVREAFTYRAKKLGRMMTMNAYGGSLCENVVQGLARDLLVHAMFLARDEGIPIVLTVHDEIVGEVESWQSDINVLKAVMETRPEWAVEMKVPVLAECWAGDRYKK